MINETNDHLLNLIKKYSIMKGDFVLASGQRSDTYIDVRVTALRSDGIVAIGQCLFHEIHQLLPEVRYVGGLALGAVPITTALTYEAACKGINDFHSVIVRKEVKDHGTKKRIEPISTPAPGTELVAIDDVVTSAGSTIQAISILRAHGYTIRHAFAIIDRESGGKKALADIGVELHSLYKLSEVV